MTNCHDGGDGDKGLHDDDNVYECHGDEDGHYDFHDDIQNISNNQSQLAGTEQITLTIDSTWGRCYDLGK